jgi:hypothetical protein
MKKKLIKSMVASMTCLSLFFSTGLVAFANGTAVPEINTQSRVEKQIEKINLTATRDITDYKFSSDGSMNIETSLTKPKLIINKDKLSSNDLNFYASMTDDEIYRYLLKCYNEQLQDINKSNLKYKKQLEQQKQDIEQIATIQRIAKSSEVIIVWPDPVTKNRTYTFKPYLEAVGYAKLNVNYSVTCYKQRFTGGRIKNCELTERISLGSWEYLSGYTYPLIETNNGEYIAFQVTGRWTVGLPHGIGAEYEKWYDFNDYNTFLK